MSPAMGSMPEQRCHEWMRACLETLPDGIAILSPVRDARGLLIAEARVRHDRLHIGIQRQHTQPELIERQHVLDDTRLEDTMLANVPGLDDVRDALDKVADEAVEAVEDAAD